MNPGPRQLSDKKEEKVSIMTLGQLRASQVRNDLQFRLQVTL